MCVMEEKKKVLEFIAPEVKVVTVASQRVLCQSEIKAEATGKTYDLDGLNAFDREAL